jgi:polyisoprenoid-binding protein YceI
MKILLIAILAFTQVSYAKDKAQAKAAPAAAGASLKCDPAQGQVTFEAIGKPSMLKIKGTGEGPEGEVKVGSTVQGDFKFKLASLKTGVDLRDTHMKDKYLQIEKFPTAELKIDSVENFNAASPEAKDLPFKGTLTVHGVARPVTGTVDIKKKDAGYSVQANFETKVTDHGIDIPSYLGVTVADAVKVSVQTDLL